MNRRHFFVSASRYSAGIAGVIASGGLLIASEAKPHADKGHGDKKPAEKPHAEKPHAEKPHAPVETKAPPANPAAAKPAPKPASKVHEKPHTAAAPRPAKKAARSRPKPVAAPSRPRTAEAVFQELKAGNKRYLATRGRKPAGVRQGADNQNPYAVLLTCADSRLPPEVVFDQGLGDLFTVRVAGNVANANEIASIEYAVGEMNTPLVVVMGHTECSAIKAVLGGGGAVLESIRQAFTRTRTSDPGLRGKPLLNAVTQMNVWESIENMLKGGPLIRDLVRSGELKIVGANFQAGTGEVTWLGPHPDQCDFV
ncbi:MAG: carbonic anhydrase [Bryobacteraceae bacterium]|nr:carbonic anhydrase [Bryobacteraceae bacterium]